jgi:hypothetical protein
MSVSIPPGMDWMQILFVTYISAGAGSGFVHSPQLHGQGSTGAGFGGMAEMHDPVHLGYIHCTLVLVISFTLIVRHKFRTSIGSPKKRLECYE